MYRRGPTRVQYQSSATCTAVHTAEDMNETLDRYGGVRVEIEANVEGIDAVRSYRERIKKRKRVWRNEGRRGIWMKIPSSSAETIPVALAEGFQLHHAAPPPAASVTLTLWLPSDIPNPLPQYPHHQIGVGAFVLNGRDEVLCVQEKSGPTSKWKDFWKLPGGLVERGEDLAVAAVREVREETGIDVVFESIATARETHTAFDGACTDIYMVCACALHPKYGKDDVPDPRPQPSEIARASWIPLETFLGSRYYRKGLYGEMLREAAKVCKRRGGMGRKVLPSLGGREESLYHARL